MAPRPPAQAQRDATPDQPESISTHARANPDKPAVIMAGTGEQRTYAELDAASIRVSNAFRAAGLRPGDTVAVVMANECAWLEVVWGALRAALTVTPVNWHLTGGEARYVVADSQASAIAVSGTGDRGLLADLVDCAPMRFATGADVPGYEDYAAMIADSSDEPPADEREGTWVFYSSGTTGRPKGIVGPAADIPFGARAAFTALFTHRFGLSADSVYLSPSPLYHASPAGWATGTQRLGGTVVLMERFDAEAFLAAVEKYRVTHVQVVPTHLVRLLKLPAATRDRYDLSSLQMVVHAAAPCPPEVKRAVLDWFGPIVHEFYAGSEGNCFFTIGPQEWLEHPGSVGRPMGGSVHILDDDGQPVAPGAEGQVWFDSIRQFEYRNDPDKTASSVDAAGRSTLGDIGRVDADGYLYLTDRVANTIVSGGVNVYPRESEDVLVVHPTVEDVAVVGRADPDLGEIPVAYVTTVDAVGTDELAAELVAYCRDRLSHFKCPRRVVFVDELPRMPNGKLLKRLLPA